MDILSIGIEAGLVVAIIAITKVITMVVDPKGTLSRWYILIPTVLAVAVAFIITKPLSLQDVLKNILIYAAVSTYFYKFGKTTVLGQ